MGTSNQIKEVIQQYLDDRAKSDEQFAISYAKKNKNIDECFAYIMGEALKSSSAVIPGAKGCMIENDEVFGLAVHYYDEDDIKVNKLPANVRTSVSAPKVELTEEDKKKAKEEAIKRLADEQHTLLSKKKTVKKKVTDDDVKQMTLF